MFLYLRLLPERDLEAESEELGRGEKTCKKLCISFLSLLKNLLEMSMWRAKQLLCLGACAVLSLCAGCGMDAAAGRRHQGGGTPALEKAFSGALAVEFPEELSGFDAKKYSDAICTAIKGELDRAYASEEGVLDRNVEAALERVVAHDGSMPYLVKVMSGPYLKFSRSDHFRNAIMHVLIRKGKYDWLLRLGWTGEEILPTIPAKKSFEILSSLADTLLLERGAEGLKANSPFYRVFSNYFAAGHFLFLDPEFQHPWRAVVMRVLRECGKRDVNLFKYAHAKNVSIIFTVALSDNSCLYSDMHNFEEQLCSKPLCMKDIHSMEAGRKAPSAAPKNPIRKTLSSFGRLVKETVVSAMHKLSEDMEYEDVLKAAVKRTPSQSQGEQGDLKTSGNAYLVGEQGRMHIYWYSGPLFMEIAHTDSQDVNDTAKVLWSHMGVMNELKSAFVGTRHSSLEKTALNRIFDCAPTIARDRYRWFLKNMSGDADMDIFDVEDAENVSARLQKYWEVGVFPGMRTCMYGLGPFYYYVHRNEFLVKRDVVSLCIFTRVMDVLLGFLATTQTDFSKLMLKVHLGIVFNQYSRKRFENTAFWLEVLSLFGRTAPNAGILLDFFMENAHSEIERVARSEQPRSAEERASKLGLLAILALGQETRAKTPDAPCSETLLELLRLIKKEGLQSGTASGAAGSPFPGAQSECGGHIPRLPNRRVSCFLNSAMQVLYHIPELRDECMLRFVMAQGRETEPLSLESFGRAFAAMERTTKIGLQRAASAAANSRERSGQSAQSADTEDSGLGSGGLSARGSGSRSSLQEREYAAQYFAVKHEFNSLIQALSAKSPGLAVDVEGDAMETLLIMLNVMEESIIKNAKDAGEKETVMDLLWVGERLVKKCEDCQYEPQLEMSNISAIEISLCESDLAPAPDSPPQTREGRREAGSEGGDGGEEEEEEEETSFFISLGKLITDLETRRKKGAEEKANTVSFLLQRMQEKRNVVLEWDCKCPGQSKGSKKKSGSKAAPVPRRQEWIEYKVFDRSKYLVLSINMTDYEACARAGAPDVSKKETGLDLEDGRLSFLGHEYRLLSFIEHHGSAVETGHYTAMIRDGEDWYNCDDMVVSRGDLRGTRSARLLVYKRCERVEEPGSGEFEESEEAEDETRAAESEESEEIEGPSTEPASEK